MESVWPVVPQVPFQAERGSRTSGDLRLWPVQQGSWMRLCVSVLGQVIPGSGVSSGFHLLVADPAGSGRKQVAAEMEPLWTGGLIGDDDSIDVTGRTGIVDEVALDQDIGEGRIVRFLRGIELERGSFLSPDPAGVPMAESGDQIVRDD